MQGKLNEIDIRSILQLIELGQRTGELFVEAYGSPTGIAEPGVGTTLRRLTPVVSHPSWLVFFLNGKIIYAGDSGGNLARLRDYLRRYQREAALDKAQVSSIAPFNAPEYGYLWSLLETHTITPAQGRSIIQGMVQETLFDLLSLHQGSFVFELGAALSPQLTTLEIAPLAAKIMKQVQEWKRFHPHIQSPNQCPTIADAARLQENLRASTFALLNRWADGQTSLRQIARYLSRDILTVARAVYPYVKQGVVQFVAPPEPELSSHSPLPTQSLESRSPRIVCIEDSITIRETIEQILRQQGYEATAIGNPLKALSLVFQLKPDLILLDIGMPELDGYEICAMLRRSTAFRLTPIIMLTGKEGFIDRLNARMVGATDYLTKPFGAIELITLVEKYVGVGHPHPISPDELLTQTLQDELSLDSIESASTSFTPHS